MKQKSHFTFLHIGAYSLITSAFTTLVAHLVNFPAADFESRILLAKNWGYILRNDIVVLHCVLVIISMLGLALFGWRSGKGWIVLGFLCFVIFGMAEIGRMALANTVVNGLRDQYHLVSDTSAKDIIYFLLEEVWPLIGTVLFRIFILAFSMGCLFYGFAFWNEGYVSKVFLLWGVVNLFAFANDFLGIGWLSTSIEYFSIIFQPIARLWIGAWFLKSINQT